MKKLLALLLALLMVLSLAACSDTPPGVEEDGPGGLEDVSDPPVEDLSIYPGQEPFGSETACGQVVELPGIAQLEYIGSKIVTDEYDDPTLLSVFLFTNEGDYEDCASWCMDTYAYQGEEELWATSFTYNDVVLDESLYEEIDAGDSLEICYVYNLENLSEPVVFSFANEFEEVGPVEFTVDLSEVENCMTVAEGMDGYYVVSYLYESGETLEYGDLEELGMLSNTYVELYDDGTGVLSMAGEVMDLTYGAMCFYIGDIVLDYYLEDGVLTLEGDDLYYEFTLGEPVEEIPEEESTFVPETLTTDYGNISITTQEGWTLGESKSNYSLTLYNDVTVWLDIVDVELNTMEDEMEYVQLALASCEYEEVTIGDNTYQMLQDLSFPPLTYLVGETNNGYAFVVEVRGVEPDAVMDMLESIRIN